MNSDIGNLAFYRESRYAKMQYQTLPKPNGRLTFETVVPNLSSTRHVAAAAFYHCLGDRAFLSFSLSRIKRVVNYCFSMLSARHQRSDSSGANEPVRTVHHRHSVRTLETLDFVFK